MEINMTDAKAIANILKRIDLDKNGNGQYNDNFYEIVLADSDEYSSVYSQLDKAAINTEFPGFGVNSSKNTVKITNYFEIDEDNEKYNIFLIADFDNDKYIVRIAKAPESINSK